MPAQTVIKKRRDTAANWVSVNPVLASGEEGYETDTGLSKTGNGTTAWASLSYDATAHSKQMVKAGESINKGQAVYVSGSDGTYMIVSKASNASEATSSKTFGLMNGTTASGAFNTVVTNGLLGGLDTSTATAGDPVWLGTSGNLIYGLASKPSAPAHLVFIGIVEQVSSTAGKIYVNIQNGFELEELHNVQVSGKTTGQVLQWDGDAWVNATVEALPAQTGNTGKYLTTDGTDASWATVDLSSKQDVVAGVSSTEIGYLDGVTSAIQTQLDGKANSSHTHLLVDITDVTATAVELNYVDGVTSAIQTQIDGKAAVSHTHDASAITYTINDKAANYTIVATDEGKVIRSTGAAITVTVADVFAIGEVATFAQYGAGQITFTPGVGVTLHSVDTKRKTNKQYSTVQLMKVAAATYLLFGDIAA